MVTVGITGGLATGKSAVTALLRTHGAIVFSADEAARAVMTPDGPTLQRIAAAFGQSAKNKDGSLNRAYLAERIFTDSESRKMLDRITHPPILRLLQAQIEACITDLSLVPVIAVEVPLLFETKMQTWFERIIVVTASQEIQVFRLASRNHLSEREARQRIAAQMPLQDKVAMADYVIVNDGAIEALRQEVARLWQDLTGDFEPYVRQY